MAGGGVKVPASSQSCARRTQDLWSEPLPVSPSDPVETIWRMLDEVVDPEIPLSLVELGLIYGVEWEDGVARIDLTFTSTACPCMDFIRDDIHDRLLRESWIHELQIRAVWSPPWTSDRITSAGRAKLYRFGMAVG